MMKSLLNQKGKRKGQGLGGASDPTDFLLSLIRIFKVII
jgi:hypothetical protein